ncbi:MAG: valine--tRNA ligase [Candidatus Buchananbacteria bacterium]
MVKIELAKAYNAAEVEDAIYEKWEKSGFFNPDNLTEAKDPFVISMPPPNVTGILHLGHAFENSLMDVEIRYQRMKGKKAMIVPGTDHAAVATQARVEGDLKKQGIANPRQELGREKLLEKIKEFAENQKSIILGQIKKMGTSCDWSRLAYTFDEQRSEAVNELFKMMYNDGLIYRGYRVINWSVKGQSTCSDDELVYVDQLTKIYTFKYGKDFPIAIATTRPETKLGDTAVAVNPKDDRYKQYIGQKFTVDVGAKNSLTITVIADDGVDTNYGTGAVGVTPAHSPVDFEMYQKNKDIGIIPVIGKDGKMTEEAGVNYAGLDVLEAREKFVNWLRENDLLLKEEDLTHSVGTSDRFGDVVEAIPMEQWFVDVNKKVKERGMSLKELMREAVTRGHNGNSDKIINITPDRFKTIYLHWIDNLRDWCISRQIWWGHRIPVWYCDDCDQIFYGSENPGACPKCESIKIRQDEDTLDTWFSSGAWTFSTLGWPAETQDLLTYHPTSWMQMGYEILFFWMARMILMTTYALDDIPFRDVYIHGILRDKNGKKFSKSLGNGLDPIEIINKYGTDALRLSLLRGTSPGNDMRFYEEKVEGARNFVNKLWNISRFIIQSIDSPKIIDKTPVIKTLADQWILDKLNSITKSVTEELDKFNFSGAIDYLWEFTWADFADWYLEIAKVEGNKEEILLYILQNLLKLWHPFIPFVTEELWKNFDDKNLLMIAVWPKFIDQKPSDADENFEWIKNIITIIRNLRSENKVEPAKKISAIIISDKIKLLENQSEIIKKLARLENLSIIKKGDKPANSVGSAIGSTQIYIELASAVNAEVEVKRLQKEISELDKYAVGIEQKLKNEEFLKNAPEAIIKKEADKLKEAREKIEKLTLQLESLK